MENLESGNFIVIDWYAHNIALPQHYFFSLFIFIFRKKNSAAVMLNVSGKFKDDPGKNDSHQYKI